MASEDVAFGVEKFWAPAACSFPGEKAREIIQRQLREQRQMEEHLAALSAHVKHLEEDLDTARKDLLQSKVHCCCCCCSC